jgi:hypothetical protein
MQHDCTILYHYNVFLDLSIIHYKTRTHEKNSHAAKLQHLAMVSIAVSSSHRIQVLRQILKPII